MHPRAVPPGLGLAPGIAVRLSVLGPGERTAPVRHNSTLADFCIRGAGTAHIGGTDLDVGRYDVVNVPSFRTYWHSNPTDEPQVRLTYSNAPLLEKLEVHLVDEETEPVESAREDDPRRLSSWGTIELNETGAPLMPYETLISPPAVESRALHWPWREVKARLDRLEALGPDYVSRRLYLLYNPATGRTNRTTPSFFATITIRPAGVVDRPHRHVSASINYYFAGAGYSRVAGRQYRWRAGDLMLAAPGWSIHNHASGDAQVYELTVQDQPLNIAMESLLWQEDLKTPPVVLGTAPGFMTNRAAAAR